MDTKLLISLVNKELAIYDEDAIFVASTQSTTPNPTSIYGSIKGKPVRLEFSIHNENPDYDFSVWLYSDAEDRLGRGNGGSDFAEAISVYHWNSALVELDQI